jgi:N-acetylglucosaminyldiphosphoundecaprenol N-acetyl-beta-D-mannosaminyltransferase
MITLKIMGYIIFSDGLNMIDFKDDKKLIVNTINPHSYATAKEDRVFNEALHSSDILIPDGSGIVLAAKLINGDKINKIAGADLHKHLLEKLNMIGGSVFYMGASQATLDKIQIHLLLDFPNIHVGTYSPPFKESFSHDDNVKIIEKINSFKPDILFIGMTAPKQEKWVHQNKEKLNFKIACSIGAVFDFYAGTVKRPSQFWLDFHLEWLLRLLKEPRRLWKRNFISTPLFLFDMFLYKFGWKK